MLHPKIGQLVVSGLRNRRTKEVELRFQRGEGVPEEHLLLFERHLAERRPTVLNVTRLEPELSLSLVEELQHRGYDLSTFRLSLILKRAKPALPKAVRRISQREGMLLARWARVEHDVPDLCSSWAQPARRCDSNLLQGFFSMFVYMQAGPQKASRGYASFLDTFTRELGYDIRTIRFECKMFRKAQDKDDPVCHG
jgi:hypothetical protein